MASRSSPDFVDASRVASLKQLTRWIHDAPRILFVTGAGLSADSGLPTYRGVGGLYEGTPTPDGFPIEELLSGGMMRSRPDLCWKYIMEIERACRGVAPNPGHKFIAQLQHQREGVVVLTQNVDGLHRIGSIASLIEIHGSLHELHCTRCRWQQTVADYAALDRRLPRCDLCGSVVRPRVVLFDEGLPPYAFERLRAELIQGFSLVVMVGTSALFPYISAPVYLASRWGARTVEINPGCTEVSGVVDLQVSMRAAVAFGALADAFGYG